MTPAKLTSTFYSDPHIQFLSQILQDIRRGELLVPRFQRPFVWLPQQQLELLRSIRQGIPIGAIMVWRTATAQIACYDSLGPFALQPGRDSGSRDYLLDGVQRLSTLYGALNAPSERSLLEGQDNDDELDEQEQQIPVRAFFDLKQLDFLFLKPSEIPLPHQLPLNILMDSVALLRYQRSLEHYPESDAMVEESDRLAGAFRQYKVPIIPIATDDLALATLTFQRINSQGQKMSDYHMLHALTWSSTFDLMRQLENLKSEYLSPVGWDGIDEDPILKVLKLTLGMDVYKADIGELSSRVVENPNALADAMHGIALAAAFLKSELAIPSYDFVPYSLQIVLLADMLRKFGELTETQVGLLKNWFWFVTYSEAFSGISDDKVRVAVTDLRRTLTLGKPVWSINTTYAGFVQPSRFDFRAVRTKSFILSMARTQKNEPGATAPTELLAEYGRRAIQQIYSPALFLKPDRELAFSLGNRVLCPPALLTRLRKALVPVPDGDAVRRLLGDHVQQPEVYTPAALIRAREQRLVLEESIFAQETAGKFWRAARENDNE